jgi:NDP-sugar pyrophosphorylase family protein
MAGGKRTRLMPLTADTPKPMLPVGDKPLLELIIGQIRAAGIRQVNIATHQLKEKITEHFGDGKRFGIDIDYIDEESPLGTAGALGLIEPPADPILVMNGDVLTRMDFRSMVSYHKKNEADLTVGVRQYDLSVPYGVVECDGPLVKQLREKPMFNFMVNAGIYVVEPAVLSYIPAGKRFDMTDFIQTLMDSGRRVVAFPVIEYWLDIGQHTDYQKAQDDMAVQGWNR